jgi:hypothetical protein
MPLDKKRGLHMSLDGIELHDALIANTVIDYARKIVVIGVQYYEKPEDKSRKPVNIVFEDVSGLSQISDLDAISKNTFAGHINHWVPVQRGTTFIYLVDGCISVTSSSVKIENGEQ